MAGKAKDTSGTCRTFPIKKGHWLYQFHGGKIVGYQQRAFIDFKMQGFPPYAKPAALLSCGLPKLYVSQMVLEIHCSQVENSFGILERECGEACGSLHLLFPSCYGGGALTWGSLCSRVLWEQTQMAEHHSRWKDLCLSTLESINQPCF